jgi:hypothetical protein
MFCGFCRPGCLHAARVVLFARSARSGAGLCGEAVLALYRRRCALRNVPQMRAQDCHVIVICECEEKRERMLYVCCLGIETSPELENTRKSIVFCLSIFAVLWGCPSRRRIVFFVASSIFRCSLRWCCFSSFVGLFSQPNNNRHCILTLLCRMRQRSLLSIGSSLRPRPHIACRCCSFVGVFLCFAHLFFL